MARTITIDGAQLNEARVVVTPTGNTAVQLSFTLLSGKTVIQQVSLQDVTSSLQASELAAANGLLTAMNAALSRLELS